MSEEARTALWAIAIFLVFVLFVIGILFLAGVLEVPWRDLDREIRQEADGTIEGVISQLQQLANEWNELEEERLETGNDSFSGQQNYLMNQMENLADRIDDDKIPDSVQRILAKRQ